MRYIECGVNNEFVSGAGQVIGAAGSHHAVAIRMTFSDAWAMLTKRVLWIDAKGTTRTETLLTSDLAETESVYVVPIPAAPLQYEGKVSMTVYGVELNGTSEVLRLVTKAAFFDVMTSYYDPDSAPDGPIDIDPTIADQMQAEIDAALADILDAREAAKDAEAWAVGQIEGADVPETDTRYENNSKYYAQRADESAAEAYSQASAAFASASGASGSATAAAGSAATAADRATAAAGSATAAAGSAANAAASADNAAGSATAAAQSATAAEGYKNTASQKAADAAGSASAAAGSATAAGTSETNAAGSASAASGSATAAAGSATGAANSAASAADSAEDSEAWAVGQRGGQDVPATDETYHNNAKYWAGEAQHAAAGGVSSFNGRSGTVEPQSGDYTAAMVGAVPATDKGAAGGVAELDTNGKIPSAQLPSYVDDVLEYETMSQFPETGESGKIYIDKLTNRTYRWGGTEYIEISESLALGETASTAYAGNKGKANADAITALQTNLNTHESNTTVHITAAERTAWNAKANFPAGGTAGQILTKTATGAEWGDAPLGFAPQVVVTAPTGSTVTLTNGTTTLTATESSGTWTFDVPSYGTWTATATLSGQTATGSVSVTEVKQYTISLAFIPEDVNDATWAQISEVSQAGTGDTYWDVGDTKAITLNGTIGTKSYSNVTLYLFILHFNMPVNKSTADNNIIWGGFKTAKSGGIDVCLDDSAYNTDKYDGTKRFNMNHNGTNSGSEGTAGWRGTNYGGWKGTDLRYDILGATNTQPSQYNQKKTTSNVGYDATQAAITSPLSNTLMAALPSDFRSALRLWTRWIDSKGNNSNVDANVTSCVDAGISLLTEFEVFGTRSCANQYEQNHQVQCAYYVAGNSKVKYRQSSTGTSAIWWESSAYYSNVRLFCSVDTYGTAGISQACYAYGLAPAFKT